MATININASNITGTNVQMGEINNITYNNQQLSEMSQELLKLINENRSTDAQKEELIRDLRLIVDEPQPSPVAAKNLLGFVRDITSGVISGATVAWLEYMAK